MKEFNELGIKPPPPKSFVGDKISIKRVLKKKIIIHDFAVKPSIYPPKKDCLHLQIEFEEERRVMFITATHLTEVLKLIPKDAFPFKATIVNPEGYFRFKNKEE